jgi:hypothetical protein
MGQIEGCDAKELSQELKPLLRSFMSVSNFTDIQVVKRGRGNVTASALRQIATELEKGGLLHANKLRLKFVDEPLPFTTKRNILTNFKNYLDFICESEIVLNSTNMSKIQMLIPTSDLCGSILEVRPTQDVYEKLIIPAYQYRNPYLARDAQNFLEKVFLEPEKLIFLNKATFISELITLTVNTPHPELVQSDAQLMKQYNMAFFHGFFIPHLVEDLANLHRHTFMWSFDSHIMTNKFLDKLTDDAKNSFFQHKLVGELSLKVSQGISGRVFTEISQRHILTIAALIENIKLDPKDTSDLGNLGFLDGYSYNIQWLGPSWEDSLNAYNPLPPHWIMMLHLYGNLTLPQNVFLPSPPNLHPHDVFQMEKYSIFYNNLYKKHPGLVFPPCNQTIFLEVWRNATRINEQEGDFNVRFLKQIYQRNQGLFWLPIIACVLQRKPIHEDYWIIAENIDIPKSDAASYLDFLYRWVFPTTFTKDDVKPILLEFRGNLTNKFGTLHSHFDSVADLPYSLH